MSFLNQSTLIRSPRRLWLVGRVGALIATFCPGREDGHLLGDSLEALPVVPIV